MECGLLSLIFIRYVDNLRLYVFPLNKGWHWEEGRWCFNADIPDEDTDTNRTMKEFNKSFNDVIDCLEFTTESQEDFETNTLPTLDVQLETGTDGLIYFSHFTKPMCNNILLERGTALSKSTIFNSLRQDLVRRMINTKRELDWDRRLQIIDEYIQLLINSGHRYRYIRALVQQALTQYEYIYSRSLLSPKNRMFRPLYRRRSFDKNMRIMLKHTNPFTWYKDINLKDPFRSKWKAKIIRKKERGSIRKRGKRCRTKKNGGFLPTDNATTTTSIFIPWTPGGKLLDRIDESEQRLSFTCDWRVKLQERSGTPLINLFLKRFPIISGCPKAATCRSCKDGDGMNCSSKNLVYEAECELCRDESNNPARQRNSESEGASEMEKRKAGADFTYEEVSEVMLGCPNDQFGRGGKIKSCPSDHSDRGGKLKSQLSERVPKQTYVGETSRTLRLRSEEHVNKAKRLEKD